MYDRGFKHLLCLLTAILLIGCATPPKRPIDPSRLQWPFPPREPRVRYVNEWVGDTDFKKGLGEALISAILGEAEWFLDYPRGVTSDSSSIYVVDTGWRVVFVFDQKAGKLRIISAEGLDFIQPYGVAVDDERVYVSDSRRRGVFVYNKKNGGFLSTIGSEEELLFPTGLALDKVRKRLYVADAGGHDIKVYDLTGKPLFRIGCDRGSQEEGCLAAPHGLALDKDGNLYVGDMFNFRFQSFTPDGKFRFARGEPGDDFGMFARPMGIAVDSDGNIYVTDIIFNNVQVFDRDGRYIFTIGEYGTDPGTFYFPASIYIDEMDRIYVADRYNKRVQEFQYLKK